MNKDTQIINATRCWIETIVVGYNFCPFAGRELARNSIHYHVCRQPGIEDILLQLIEECRRLDTTDTIETTLLILPDQFSEFDEFLDLLEIAERLMIEQGYEGIYQLASFHPLYCFADSTPEDPANYTNRSPYPMLHLLRESSLEAALTKYEQPERIPENNIKKATNLGLEKLRSVLQSCYQTKE
jgi:hypothetical protein